MAETRFDIAVIGSSPGAALMAGILARGKSVCLLAERFSPLKLMRGFDLGAAPVTRPETWALIARTTPEILRLAGRIAGKAGHSRVDPLFLAEGEEGAAGLGHVYHMAAAFGLEVERVRPREGLGGAAIRLRDIAFLQRPALMAGMEAWLTRQGVTRLSRRDTRVTWLRAGGARFRQGPLQAEAERVVLADDQAILDLVGDEALPQPLAVSPATAVLTEPVRPLPAPLMVEVEHRVVLWQDRARCVRALATLPPGAAEARLGALLASYGPVRRAGQARLRVLVSRDGAPVIGPLGRSTNWIVSGLGPLGAFVAPALARVIDGRAEPEDATWVAARAPGPHRRSVAEIGGDPAQGVAA